MVRGLDLPEPFTVEELCRRLGQRRGRRIILVPRDLPPGSPCGLCVSTETSDFIFFHEGTSGPHQLLIILHELGHLLCGHGVKTGLHDDDINVLMPDLDPVMVRRILGRTRYGSEEEVVAETIATLILSDVGVYAPSRKWKIPDEVVGVVRRISYSIGPGDGDQ
ncbi:ImmA/IrrE family metallo-endopeptidase [Sinosporangium album]|uniref:ImmA/IrrE family metallo-endopeptidase n=1 Tax=Sinosporangium album TaxID=504805 RepID=UPI00115FDCE4|nr:hypothetical protein [Sinosporangium album]